MANWIEHVKQYAKDHNISYREALSQSRHSYGGNGSGQASGFIQRMIAENKFDITKMKNPSQDLIDKYGKKSRKDELNELKSNLATYKKSHQTIYNDTDKQLNELKSKKGITKVKKDDMQQDILKQRESKLKALRETHQILKPYLKKHNHDLNAVLKSLNSELGKEK